MVTLQNTRAAAQALPHRRDPHLAEGPLRDQIGEATAAGLREWIGNYGWTIAQAARVLGLSVDGLKKKLSGVSPVGRQTLIIMRYVDDRGGPIDMTELVGARRHSFSASVGTVETRDGVEYQAAAVPHGQPNDKKARVGYPIATSRRVHPAASIPAAPTVTSKANRSYQRRFDALYALALASKWDEVRGYEVKGINSYAKMLTRYRDILITYASAAAA